MKDFGLRAGWLPGTVCSSGPYGGTVHERPRGIQAKKCLTDQEKEGMILPVTNCNFPVTFLFRLFPSRL
ncbi:hypothetical protein OBV_02480 [Oscillibacter valericigenes Sjm18-20]|nr:hypothetical protein OBV_02480 [Oscillibacter valericigenes Sjm18-20]